MSYASATETVLSRLNTQWASRTPIAWPNSDYEPVAGTAFIRPTLFHPDAFNAQLGRGRQRHIGLLVVQVLTPEKQGDGAAMDHAAALVTAFENVDAGGIHYEVPRVDVIGNDGAGWYQVNVSVPLWRDETS